jgi:hypothetical protein
LQHARKCFAEGTLFCAAASVPIRLGNVIVSTLLGFRSLERRSCEDTKVLDESIDGLTP